MSSAVKTPYGKLDLVLGPMFSGKTSELLRKIRRYQLSRYTILIIKYMKDSRYAEDSVATHDGKLMSAVKASALQPVKNTASQFQVIGIDEGQFFPDIHPFCLTLLALGKIIIVAGLDGTFKRTGFNNILELVPLAHTIEKLSAVCMCCGSKASFTKRIGAETEIEVIGGADKYMAVCRECYKIESPPKSTVFKELEEQEVTRIHFDKQYNLLNLGQA